jgi:hypothetical protein
MNNSLFCPHNILLSQRCPRCIVERRVSYSNRLQNLINLTEYENRLITYDRSLFSYNNALLNYVEIQIMDKIISDINYLLTLVDNNSYRREEVNIRRFYNSLLSDLNLFSPSSFHIRQENLRIAENLIRENRNLIRTTNQILNRTNNSIISQRVNNVGRPSIRFNTTDFNNTTNVETTLSLSIKNLNENTSLEIYQREENEEEQMCAICITPLENNTIIRKLSCQHKFHYKCVDKWFEEKHKCPICRHSLLNYVMV